MRIRGRLRRGQAQGDPAAAQGPAEGDYVEIDASELTGVFAAPSWLRDIGLTSWLLVGVALLLMGLVWLASLTQTIVAPVVTAAVVAAVASPLVAWMNRHRIPRPLAAVFIMLGLIAVGVGLFLMVVGGITSEASDIGDQLGDARSTLQGWLEDVGIDPSTAAEANKNASASISESFSQLKDGLAQRDQRPFRARLLPRPDHPQPVLPPQRRTQDPPLGRGALRGAAARRAHHQREDARSASRLLPRRHPDRGVQRGCGDPRRADPRGPADRHDRGGHLRRRLTSRTWERGPPPPSRSCSPWAEPGPRRPAG